MDGSEELAAGVTAMGMGTGMNDWGALREEGLKLESLDNAGVKF